MTLPPAPGAIIQPPRNAWRIVTAEHAGVLVDAADYYLAFYEAARRAQRYIVVSGWQFDSGVPLVRGDQAPPGEEVRFLKFLNGLCERRPALHVYLLAWDFHPVLALEREWWQRVYFHWMTNARLRFRFDASEVDGGSHHQKFVVIDGALAFVGGMDLCEARWDDRRHLAQHPLRYSRGKPQKPYHDVQAFVAGGDAPAAFAELFGERWARHGGDRLVLLPAPPDSPSVELPRGLLTLPAGMLALSRTDPRKTGPVREVEQLLVDAITASEECVYLETQYFSSRRIFDALASRMRASGRSKLQIVVVVNERAEAVKEELAVGLRQADIIEKLREVAGETRHDLGIYWSRPAGKPDPFPSTYIHSKVTMVDDRFLSVGSANLTNRSMGVDTELHATWEASPDARSSEMMSRIRDIRVSLLAEHSGHAGNAIETFGPLPDLVARLDAIADRSRLRKHGPPSPAQRAALDLLDPQSLPFDPADPGTADMAAREEPSDQRPRGRLASSIASARRWLARKRQRR